MVIAATVQQMSCQMPTVVRRRLNHGWARARRLVLRALVGAAVAVAVADISEGAVLVPLRAFARSLHLWGTFTVARQHTQKNAVRPECG